MRSTEGGLPESSIARVARSGFGLDISAIASLPWGADAASRVFRIQTRDGQRLVLKARQADWFSPASLVVPFTLWMAGIHDVVAPLETLSKELWVSSDGFEWSLYPFIEGDLAAHVGLTETQWFHLGTVLRQVHEAHLEPGLAGKVPKERFVPSRIDTVKALAEVFGEQGRSPDPSYGELATFWKAHGAVVDTLVQHCSTLGAELRSEALPCVLCHADLHVWNILVDATGRPWMLDWDEVVLAPKERDLMFVVGSIGRDLVLEAETRSFMRGYGRVDLSPRALTYYRAAWALQDIGAYAERVLSSSDRADPGREAAFQSLLGLFDSGNIVDIALRSTSVEN